jgi:hypothetical protein
MGRAIAAVALVLCAAPGARAQTKTGTSIGDFLLIEPSARIAGMGNAGVSIDEGLDAVYYNPATLAWVDRVALDFSHAAWIAGISYDYAAVAIPLGRWGSGMASVTSLRSEDMDVRTVAFPLGTGERFSVDDVAIGLGYARQITDRFAVGGQVSWMQETIWHSSLSTAVFAVGTLYRLSERGPRIGSSLSNVGTQAHFEGEDLRITWDPDPSRSGDNGTLPAEQFTGNFPLPVLFRVGVGLPVQLSRNAVLGLALDAFHPRDNTESVSAGAELRYRRLVAVRLGWQNLFQQDSELGLTGGAGVTGRLDDYGYRLDYAWADHGRLGSAQRFTVGVTF